MWGFRQDYSCDHGLTRVRSVYTRVGQILLSTIFVLTWLLHSPVNEPGKQPAEPEKGYETNKGSHQDDNDLIIISHIIIH